MRRAAIGLLTLLLLIILIPFAIVKCTHPTPTGRVEEDVQRIITGEGKIKVYIKKLDRVEDIDLEEYIKGVVSAEMPAGFPPEALKAQAVAARTYIANRVINGGENPDYKGAQVSTDPTTCTAWISKDDAFKNWGNNAEANWKKVSDAVDATKGEIITYDDKPISAVFYSISSGKTEDAKDVWGSEIPYLKSVDSSDDKKAEGYESKAEFTPEEFKARVQKLKVECKLEGDPMLWVGQPVRSPAGGVKEIAVGNINFSGMDMRKAFDLRSHNFTLRLEDGKFKFDVIGHGHNVGLSQYGAKFLAEKGKSYKDILNHYYVGVSIVKIEKD